MVDRPFRAQVHDIYRAMAMDVALVAISERQASTADEPIARVIHHGIDVDAVPYGDGSGGYALRLALSGGAGHQLT